jgi:peptidoglycan hydrolase CwlO-like protein
MKKKFIYIILALIGMSVGCEKQDWFSPEEVDAIRNGYETQITSITFAKNELLTQVGSLTSQIETLEDEITELETTSTTQLQEIADLTDAIEDLNTDIGLLDAEIVTLTESITSINTTNTELESDISTLNTEITTLNTTITSLQSDITDLETDVQSLQDFKNVRAKLDEMVAATITDINLNSAIDSVSIGLTSTSVSPTVLRGLISTEATWLFNNAVKSGTTSMTTNVSTFYDTSLDTNVVNFRTLVEELTIAWNTAKESTLILWFIEFVKEFENL